MTGALIRYSHDENSEPLKHANEGEYLLEYLLEEKVSGSRRVLEGMSFQYRLAASYTLICLYKAWLCPARWSFLGTRFSRKY
jgi:hypothetical protein